MLHKIRCPKCNELLVKIIYKRKFFKILQKKNFKNIYWADLNEFRGSTRVKFHCNKCNSNYYSRCESFIKGKYSLLCYEEIRKMIVEEYKNYVEQHKDSC